MSKLLEVFENEKAEELFDYFVAYKKLNEIADYFKCVAKLNNKLIFTINQPYLEANSPNPLSATKQ